MVGRVIVAVLVVLGLVWMPLIESEKMNCFKSLIHKCPLAKKPSENQLKSPRNLPENKLEQTLGGGYILPYTPGSHGPECMPCKNHKKRHIESNVIFSIYCAHQQHRHIICLYFSRGRQWQAISLHCNHPVPIRLTYHGHIHRGIGLATSQ